MYELGFYIPEDGILHSHRREDLKSYIEMLEFLNGIRFNHMTKAEILHSW
jgi:hypothetical protein